MNSLSALYKMRKGIIILIGILSFGILQAQDEKKVVSKTDTTAMNLDAVYDRPFMQFEKIPVALGGYIEANTSYFGSEGVSEGLSFQIPRMTLFLSSTIADRIKFLTEIEFEEGGKEIAIEFAAFDVEFAPILNLRGGIMMNPIGAFNQNHDGPKWEFIDRPIVSTTIVPSTWSNVGFGVFGKTARNNWAFAYEAYLTNGFDDSIIANEENRTWLPESKKNAERFEESNNGIPLVTLKTAIKNFKYGEIGLSWMGGVYNKFEEDGLQLDEKRRLDLFAIDFNGTIPKLNTKLIGEYIWANINVPETYSQQFGKKQKGGFVDIVQPVMKKRVLNWENSTLNLALRLEYTDYNDGVFIETGGNIFDHTYAIVPALSFRPSSQTVFRFNYRMDWYRDILGNPKVKTIGFQFGFSSYF
jgi:hypothetical protein